MMGTQVKDASASACAAWEAARAAHGDRVAAAGGASLDPAALSTEITRLQCLKANLETEIARLQCLLTTQGE